MHEPAPSPGGDFKRFPRMDTTGTGTVSLEEWLSFMRQNALDREAEKESKGYKWAQAALGPTPSATDPV